MSDCEERFSFLKNDLKQRGADVSVVEKAYNFAKSLHTGQLRKDGKPYISHPLEVAIILSELGLDEDVICAGLLHDVVEDCNCTVDELAKMFNSKIANLVDAVSAIENNEYVYSGDIFEDAEFVKSSAEEQTFNKLIAFGKKNPLAFSIKFADRLHNLRTISIFNRTKQIEKVKETEQWILPLAKVLNTEFFYRHILNECFKISNDGALFFKHYQNFHMSNRNNIEKLTLKFKEAFSNTSIKDIIFLDILENKVYSNISYLIKGCSLNNISQGQIIKVANYNIYLLCEENNKKLALSEFISKMQKQLYSHVKIIDAKIGNFTKKPYFVIQDNIRNKYYVSIMSKTEFIKQLVGTLDGQLDNLMEEESTHTIPTEYIKIKTRSGETKFVPKDSTVLDFAFKLHKNIGFAFKYAIINDSKNKSPAYTKLNDGDKVNIVIETGENGEPVNVSKIRWLAYVNTDLAKRNLIKWFEKFY